MADELNAVVQRMIDAGESEENIGTVIQHYKAAYRPDPTMQAATQRAAARSQGAILPPRQQTDELGNEVGGMAAGPAKNFIGNVVNNPITEGAAHPSTVGDLSSMLLPSGFGGAMRGAKDTASAVGEGLSRIQIHPSALLDVKLNQPLSALKGLFSIKPPAAPVPPSFGGAYMPPTPPPLREFPTERVPAGTAAPAGPPSGMPGLSAEDIAALRKQGFAPDVIEKIAQRAAPSSPLQPIAPVASHPLTGPRVDVGAELVGRQSGLSKQAVREATGPILGEAPGEASHVLPEKPLQRLIDTMKALPKEGEARTAYVQAAKDPKTMAQLENLRRTLKHLGLGTAAAVGSRQMLLGQLDADQ